MVQLARDVLAVNGGVGAAELISIDSGRKGRLMRGHTTLCPIQ